MCRLLVRNPMTRLVRLPCVTLGPVASSTQPSFAGLRQVNLFWWWTGAHFVFVGSQVPAKTIHVVDGGVYTVLTCEARSIRLLNAIVFQGSREFRHELLQQCGLRLFVPNFCLCVWWTKVIKPSEEVRVVFKRAV